MKTSTALILSILVSITTFTATATTAEGEFKSIENLGFKITESISIPNSTLSDFKLIKIGADWVIARPGSNLVIKGDIIDLSKRESIVSQLKRPYFLKTLKSYPEHLKISYLPPSDVPTTSTLTIFTDTSCPYCQKLHVELPALNEAGVRIDYIPFARGYTTGSGYADLVSIWCSDDKKAAMDSAMNNTLLSSEKCLTQAVSRGYQLSDTLTLSGTPAIFTEKGTQISGYLPAHELLAILNSESE